MSLAMITASSEPTRETPREEPLPAAGDTLDLIAMMIEDTGMTIRPAAAEKPWMARDSARFVARCLPMMIANRAGWELLNPASFDATWDGTPALDAVAVRPHDMTKKPPAISHFGLGILTWHVPFLFRTPPGFNLLVRGPANLPKDAIAPLEGLVETDWTCTTFTMNWKFTRPGATVTFARDEPIAMLVPMRRGELEQFRPNIVAASERPADQASFQEWSASRRRFLADPRTNWADRTGWQRDYMLGRDVRGATFPDHQTRLELAPFQMPSVHPPAGVAPD
jgi:hypothetical protein